METIGCIIINQVVRWRERLGLQNGAGFGIMVNMHLGVEYTPEETLAKKLSVLESCRCGESFTLTEACEKTGVSHWQAWKWLKYDPDFASAWEDAKEAAKERLLDACEFMLRKNILQGDNTAMIFYMKTIGRLRGYQERVQVDTTIRHEIDIKEAAKRIAFAMNQAIDAGEVLEGNFSELVPVLSDGAQAKKDLYAIDKSRTRKAEKALRTKKGKPSARATSSALSAPQTPQGAGSGGTVRG